MTDFHDHFGLVDGEEQPVDVERIHVGACGTKRNTDKAVPGTVLEHDTYEGRFLLTGNEASPTTSDKFLLVYRADDEEELDYSNPDKYKTRSARMECGNFRVSTAQPRKVTVDSGKVARGRRKPRGAYGC